MFAEGISSAWKVSSEGESVWEGVPEAEVARGSGAFAPWKGLDLGVAVTAKISQEQLEARPEALSMSHCVLLVVLSENTVLGVMIHEVSQILAGYFLSSFFVLFIFFFGQPCSTTIHFSGHRTAYLGMDTQLKELRMPG